MIIAPPAHVALKARPAVEFRTFETKELEEKDAEQNEGIGQSACGKEVSLQRKIISRVMIRSRILVAIIW